MENLGTNPPTWGGAQLIAAGPKKGVWWTEIQFGDTDGDNATGYIAVNRLSGESYVWRNLGFREDSSINWGAPTMWTQGRVPSGFNIKIVAGSEA